MANTVTGSEQPQRYQPPADKVTALDLVKTQEYIAASIKRLQDQINALEARVTALE